MAKRFGYVALSGVLGSIAGWFYTSLANYVIARLFTDGKMEIGDAFVGGPSVEGWGAGLIIGSIIGWLNSREE